MPLSDDQRAMLRLLAQREQGYEDIAALMGLSVDEVRAKVKDALDQLQAEGKEAPTVAEPPAPEPIAAPEPPRTDPEPLAPVEPPQPEPPVVPAPPPTPADPPPPAAAPASPPAAAPAKKPRDKGFGIAVAAGVAGAIVIVVLAILLLSGSDGSDSSDSTSAAGDGTTTSAEETTGAATAANKEPTEASLEPVGDSAATGKATFGRVKNSLALGVELKGLEPTGKTDSYAIWLAQSPQRMLPLAATEAPKGVINASFEVPTEVLAYLANETFGQIVVTKTQNKLLEAALAKATKEEKAPAYTGIRIAEGTVTGPIVGAANQEEAEKEAEAE